VTARATSPLIIAAVVLADLTWLLLVWAWLFTLDGPLATTFSASFLSLAIALAIICGAGRLAPRDLGITVRGVLGGLGVVALAWLAGQLVLVVAALVTGGPLAAPPHLASRAGELLWSQVAGNALAEEVIYRGFLLVQLALIARRWLSSRAAWALALFASQLIFALSHIPARWITMDLHGAALAQNLVLTAAWGLIFSVTFLRTRMLGVAIGFHALFNVPVMLVDAPLQPMYVYLALLVVLLVAWPRLDRALSRTSGRPPDAPP
jgi:CAAX protease family protein